MKESPSKDYVNQKSNRKTVELQNKANFGFGIHGGLNYDSGK